VSPQVYHPLCGVPPTAELPSVHDLDQVIDALPVAAYVCDAPDGAIRLWNRRAADVWGREPASGEVRERYCGSLRLFRADGSPLPHAAAPVAEVLRTGEPRMEEVVIGRPDLVRVAVRVHASPLRDASGQVTGAVAVLHEITDQERAKEALWVSEARYRTIVEDQPDLVCRFLTNGTLTFANEAYCAYFAIDRDSAIGRDYSPVVHPDDLPAVQAQVARLSPANPVGSIENRVIRADGTIRWTEWTNRAFFDETGRVVEFQSAGRDVTARKQTEQDAARLAAIVANADSAIFGMTLGGTITSWNRAAERMFGYSAEEAVGRPISMIIPPDRLHEGNEILGRLGRGETVKHFETERVARDGRRIPVSLTVSPIRDASGRLIGISKIVRDISDRLRTERELQEREGRFRLMLEGISDAFSAVDREWRFTYVNDHFTRLIGRERDALLGRVCWPLLPGGQQSSLYPAAHDAMRNQRPTRVEACCAPLDRWFETRLYPSPDGLIAFTTDITDRKRLDAARERAVERESEARAAAEEASRLKDEFLAVVSHELRTPLNAMLGWAQMLREGSVQPENVSKALDTIERNARMQAQLVEDLLDVSRIVTGKLPLDIQPVDLVSVVRAAVEAVRPAAANKNIELAVNLGEPQTIVSGDAGRLQQAVWNLLTNSVKFTPRKGRIDIALRRTSSDAMLTVHDTGSGIPSEALPFIFDRFRQADSRTTRAHGGLGLGLTIVEHLAEAHGGAVRADSAGPGRGATFTITIPIREGKQAADQDGPAPPHLPDLTGCHVLYVDDDADAREIIVAVVERCGAEVVTAGSVAHAMEMLRDTTPDILIGDIGMPGQDGYDLIRAVRALPRLQRVPAIALTAYAGAEHRAAALAAGYDLHLGKPVDPDALCTAIVELSTARS
jgi:PAS domain S-box-containing protein